MEDYSKLKLIIGKMDLESPSYSFTNNVMRMVEIKEIKWTFDYVLKYVLPFGVVALAFIAIFVLNLFNIHLSNLYDIFPTKISPYLVDLKFFTRILSYGLSTTFGLILVIKQIKNKLIKS